ncbi:MAG: hypothetical protein H6951_19425 [Zoogloeaceae bacterium]|nr:hypothetical protein [Zoogloeaceae bacterium]
MTRSYFPDYWPEFVADCWERVPTVIPSGTPEPLATRDEVFRALLALGRQFRADADRPIDRPTFERSEMAEIRRGYVKLLIDHARLLGPVVESYLPDARDRNLGDYINRLCSNAGSHGVMLYVTDFQLYAPEIWLRACKFLKPLYERVGMPAGYADLELFMGRYDSTPGGAHRDRGTAFHFVIDGRKTMYVWPRPQFWSDEIFIGREFNPLCWRDHLGDAVALEGGPGDILYWAIDHWHVGGSPEFSVSLNIALYRHGCPTDFWRRALTRAIASPELGSYPFQLTARDARADILPEEVRTVFATVRDRACYGAMEQAAIIEWLCLTTGFGFTTVPPRRPSCDLKESDTIVGRKDFPILWTTVVPRSFVYSANGHSSSIPDNEQLPKFFEELNQGRPVGIDTLVDRYSYDRVLPSSNCAAPHRSQLLSLLNDLYTMRAIEKVAI